MRKVQFKTKDPQLRNFFEIFRSFNLRQMHEAVSFLPRMIQEKETEEKDVVWIKEEKNFYGTIVKTSAKFVVLNCDNGLTYKIKVSPEQLKIIKENPDYKNCGILVSYRQRTDTWEYDSESFEMVEIFEHNPVYDEEYLNGLIEKSTPRWESVGDPDKWLKEIRGYENEE